MLFDIYLDLECVSMSIPRCQSYTSGPRCVGCESGYYLAATNLCVSCILPCLSCSSAISCSSCDTSQSLYMYQTFRCRTCNYFTTNCYTCTGTPSNFTCTACNTGFYPLSATNCASCPVSCSSCTASTTCTACKNMTYSLSGSSCSLCSSFINNC